LPEQVDSPAHGLQAASKTIFEINRPPLAVFDCDSRLPDGVTQARSAQNDLLSQTRQSEKPKP
jgi:hypothetical protein